MGFDNGVANVREVGNALPVHAAVAPAALGAALDGVARHGAGGELVPVVGAPAEGMDHGREREARIGDPSGDDDVRPLAQRLHDRRSAEVSVGREHAVANLAQRAARVEVLQVVAPREQAVEPREEVVARHDPDPQLPAQPELPCGRGHRLPPAPPVHPAGVRRHVPPPPPPPTPPPGRGRPPTRREATPAGAAGGGGGDGGPAAPPPATTVPSRAPPPNGCGSRNRNRTRTVARQGWAPPSRANAGNSSIVTGAFRKAGATSKLWRGDRKFLVTPPPRPAPPAGRAGPPAVEPLHRLRGGW